MSNESRLALIRFGYERLNELDLDGVLSVVTDDVIWPDVVTDSVLHGRAEVRDYYAHVFAIVRPQVTVGEVFAMGDDVIATTYQQFYDLDGQRLGEPRVVVNRFSFRGDQVCAMSVTSQDDIPQEVRRRWTGP